MDDAGDQNRARFIKLDGQGSPLIAQTPDGSWDCVLDRKTALLWEMKTTHGLRSRDNTYSWYNPDPLTNGGDAGVRNDGRCRESECDTMSYINAVNRLGLCGHRDWRLPAREELRSIVDYQRHSPQPTVDIDYFPNTLSQFYWSSTSEANAADSAWGIGFTFGYDYSYFKSDWGYIRLVTGG